MFPFLDFDIPENNDNLFDLPNPHSLLDNLATRAASPSRGLNDSLLYEPSSDYEALVQKWVSEYITNAQVCTRDSGKNQYLIDL